MFLIVLYIASPVRISVLSRQYYNINASSRACGILQSSLKTHPHSCWLCSSCAWGPSALPVSTSSQSRDPVLSIASSITRAAVRFVSSAKQSRFFLVGLCYSASASLPENFFPTVQAVLPPGKITAMRSPPGLLWRRLGCFSWCNVCFPSHLWVHLFLLDQVCALASCH